MAKGHICRACGNYMYARKPEENQPKGSWVTYECISAKCSWDIRVFEPK